jgi:predicted DNA-binding transcriptional regulator AlpA
MIMNDEVMALTAPGLPRLYTVPDLCAYLDRSPYTLQRWRSEGGGPKYSRIGNRIFYSEADILAWLKITSRRNTSD